MGNDRVGMDKKMYKYTRAILKNIIDTQGSSFDKKLQVALETIHIAYNFIESQQQEIERLKCCGNCGVEVDFLTMEAAACKLCSRNPSCMCDVLIVDGWEPKDNKAP